ncbi:hypothetical protein [Neorhodopirellula pilleata]|uniref:Uncharacterized protein n=1 Tax=Neorhodopirellula pilleata TaxID=2714738 RepID=A0A5C6A7U8_9BACT|nr:hypothetical protein [Neorhodopirellula pilleata]TWT95460.1 hypothetical protein Pla100_31010 [Neorhodopirellula pilleata]
MSDQPSRPLNDHMIQMHRARLEEVETDDLQLEVDNAERSELSLEEIYAMRLILDARGLHQYRPEPRPVREKLAPQKSKTEKQKFNFIKAPCIHCNAVAIVPNVSVSQTAEAGSTGLEYKGWGIFTGSEPLLADVCTRCGTINRFYVRNPNRDWLQK